MVKRVPALCVAFLAMSVGLPAQQPPAQGGRGRGGPAGPVVVSPLVNPDRTVTLRLLAPKATEVTVTGELATASPPKAMTKGDDGIWTATLGPVPPDVYTYAFNVDGVNTTDPRNPWVKLVSATGLASQVEVPGDGPQFWDSKPVPHGLVQIMTYESKAIGATRQAYVYTPPDYIRGNTRYPVLYLLHGGGDLDPGWSMTGRAHIIMDNLLAEKKATPDGRGDAAGARRWKPRPRPVGYVPRLRAVPARRRRAAGAGARAPAGPAALQPFAQRFLRRPAAGGREDVPRVGAPGRSRDRRPVGGRSRDDQHRLQPARSVPLRHHHERRGRTERRSVVSRSSSANSAAAAKQMKLIWLAAGDEDFALDGTKAIDEMLTKHGIKHSFKITQGRHEWRLWRPHLYEFAQLLFR